MAASSSRDTALPQAEVPGEAPTTTDLKAQQGQVVPVVGAAPPPRKPGNRDISLGITVALARE